METKKATGTLPTLGKVALKKMAAPAVTSAPVLVRRVVVAEADDIVRNAHSVCRQMLRLSRKCRLSFPCQP